MKEPLSTLAFVQEAYAFCIFSIVSFPERCARTLHEMKRNMDKKAKHAKKAFFLFALSVSCTSHHCHHLLNIMPMEAMNFGTNHGLWYWLLGI
jgi:hypothetical protein